MQCSTLTERNLPLLPPFPSRRLPAYKLAALRRVVEYAVEVAFDVNRRDLRGPTRGTAEAAFARQVAMYLAHVACGLSFSETGRAFGRDRTTVSHACAVVEDSRDDAGVDRILDLLEISVARLADVTVSGSCEIRHSRFCHHA